jgi:hypothetical protein
MVKVAKLIEILQKCPPDYEVLVGAMILDADYCLKEAHVLTSLDPNDCHENFCDVDGMNGYVQLGFETQRREGEEKTNAT